VLDFIQIKYKDKLLFHACNHPSNALYEYVYNELVKQCSQVVELHKKKDVPINWKQCSELQYGHTEFIYPCVIKAYQFKFSIQDPRRLYKEVNTKKYIRGYINQMKSLYCKK